MENDLKVICLETSAFYSLVQEVVEKLKKENEIEHDKWISKEEAKHLLRITSDTTIGKLCSEGKIRYSQPEHKIKLYDRESILLFLENSAKEILE